MQISMQDIRRLGYLKIVHSMDDSFVQRIRMLNNDNYSIKCTSYGFPAKWADNRGTAAEWYVGMGAFVLYCEPMFDSIHMYEDGVDVASIKRKFRNKWDSLWKDISTCLGLSDQDCEILSDFGIRLAFCEPSSIPSDVVRFYNAILVWFINMQYESRLSTQGYSVSYILERLTMLSSDEFIKVLLKEWL